MSPYGIGQGIERGVGLASQIMFSSLMAKQQKQRLEIDQQRLNLQKRAQSLKAFGDPSAWDRLDQHRQDPTPSPAELLIPAR